MIVPTLTYIASVNAITYVGAKPIFVDSEITTWNIDRLLKSKKITKKKIFLNIIKIGDLVQKQ